MTANNSWQTQGRQQHGWFGNGTSPRDVHTVDAERHLPARRYDGPLGHIPRSDAIMPVYPLEYLLGLAGGASIGRTLLSAAMRNLGWREPSPRPDGSPPIIAATRRGQNDEPNLTVHQGRQDKHILGTSNYIEGRSLLIAKAKDLIVRFAGRGEQVGSIPVGKPGSIEAFDTGNEVIGTWKDLSGNVAETTRGTIQYAKDGVHIVPAPPRGFVR